MYLHIRHTVIFACFPQNEQVVKGMKRKFGRGRVDAIALSAETAEN